MYCLTQYPQNSIRCRVKGFVAKDTDLGVSLGYNCLLFAHTRGWESGLGNASDPLYTLVALS